jgi:hypothetical protein
MTSLILIYVKTNTVSRRKWKLNALVLTAVTKYYKALVELSLRNDVTTENTGLTRHRLAAKRILAND